MSEDDIPTVETIEWLERHCRPLNRPHKMSKSEMMWDESRNALYREACETYDRAQAQGGMRGQGARLFNNRG